MSYRTAGIDRRHVASLPEVESAPQQMGISPMFTSSFNLNGDIVLQTDSVNCIDNMQSSFVDIDSIDLFREVLSGREPSRQPGTASRWVNIQHGGAESNSVILPNNSDRLLIIPGCKDGSCACRHKVGLVYSQLKPCGLGSWLLSNISAFSEADVYVVYGSYYGFPILDVTQVKPYECANYTSITEGEGFLQMSKRIEKELESEKNSICTEKPKCIHALGTLFKSNGKIRPITDCKRPLKKSINNAMETSCYSFSYANIDNVANLLQKNDYLCVVDIDNAY